MSKKIKPIKIFPTKKETEEKEDANDCKEQQKNKELELRVYK